ncbi:MAG TPA: class I SAM-dependent methyltransferase [Pyrinomonadaceae bacterium]|nr:class I SAM-dependent methyltransferase [Pyrinomonadaceae bacterium]
MDEQTNESGRPASATAGAIPNAHSFEGAGGDSTPECSSGAAGEGVRDGKRATPVDRRPSSLVLKIFLGAAATFSLLGGALAFQQPRPAKSTRAQQPASAQSPARDADGIDRPTSEPYTGSLSIFEDPKRDEKLQIGRVMDVLKIKEGSGVADIGAGSGWFTVRAARRVGQSGTVFAVEINPAYVTHIERRARGENLTQVRAVLGKEDDPLLPEASVDAVLILKTYHEIAEPVRLMRNLRKSLRPGALVGIIDRAGKGDDHGLDAAKVIAEAGRAGYTLVEQHDFVKPDNMDYFLVFAVRD